MFNQLQNLQVLNIGENEVETIGSDTFEQMTNLLTINMNGNKIEYLKPGIFANQFLTKVNMSLIPREQNVLRTGAMHLLSEFK